MIKTTLGRLVDCSSSNGNVGPIERLGGINLPVKTSFRFAELMDMADKKLQHFVKCRLDLYKKHGERDEENTRYELKTEEAQAAFQADYEELLNLPIEFPGERFKMKDFFGSSSVAANDIRALRWLIDFGIVESASAEIGVEDEIQASEETESEEILELEDAKAAGSDA